MAILQFVVLWFGDEKMFPVLEEMVQMTENFGIDYYLQMHQPNLEVPLEMFDVAFRLKNQASGQVVVVYLVNIPNKHSPIFQELI